MFLIIVYILTVKVTAEILFQLLRDTIHATVMGEYQCRLTVRIGATHHIRGNTHLGIGCHHRLPPESIHRDIGIILTTHSLETLGGLTESLSLRIKRHIIAADLLQHYKVTTDISTGFVTEHTVRQTERTDQTGILCDFLTDRIIGRRVHKTA